MNLLTQLTDKTNALECLAAAADVYNTCTIETEDAHANVIQLPNCILVALRGSKSPEDWLNDLDFPKIITIYGQVHTGIWRSYLTIAAKIHAALRLLPPLPIVVTGHSMGGAQAILCANDLRMSKFDVVLAITFGGPRVGDEEFRQNYDQYLSDCTLRYVNARDIVPRLPFSNMGYVHVGQEGFLPFAGGLELNPGVWELLHDDVVGMLADVRAGNIALLNDHHLPEYQKRLLAVP